MPEVKEKVDTYMINYACDDCNEINNRNSFLIKKGKGYLIDLNKFELECPNCKKIFIMDDIYPKTIYITSIEKE